MSIIREKWIEILGALGVIAGLAFVGFELKQSRDIAIAQMYQDRAALDIQTRTYMAPSETVFSAFSKAIRGESLERSEEVALGRSYGNILIYWETNHLLYEMGMLSNEHWKASLRSMKYMSKAPGFVRAWEEERNSFRISFQNIVESQIQ